MLFCRRRFVAPRQRGWLLRRIHSSRRRPSVLVLVRASPRAPIPGRRSVFMLYYYPVMISLLWLWGDGQDKREYEMPHGRRMHTRWHMPPTLARGGPTHQQPATSTDKSRPSPCHVSFPPCCAHARWVRFETSRLGPPRDSVQAPVAPLAWHGRGRTGRRRRRAYYYQQRRTHVTIRSTMARWEKQAREARAWPVVDRGGFTPIGPGMEFIASDFSTRKNLHHAPDIEAVWVCISRTQPGCCLLVGARGTEPQRRASSASRKHVATSSLYPQRRLKCKRAPLLRSRSDVRPADQPSMYSVCRLGHGLWPLPASMMVWSP